MHGDKTDEGSGGGTPTNGRLAARADAAGVLVVDDELSVRDSLESWFRKDGYRAASARDAKEALKLLQEASWDVVLLDIKMPGMDGMELQRRIHEIDPGIIVIMITAYASVETAVRALKEGAFDYITKPIDPDELSHLVKRGVEQRQLKAENVQLRKQVDRLSMPGTIVGESPQMQKVLEMAASVARTDATVLIRGESGTGKELIAQAIHANSARSYFPIIPVNCGALPESLLESELFGHEKGAFTGAQYRRKGKLEMADGGTLFLDEIGTISLRTQVDLLRVLETKEFTRLGGSKSIRVDFRVICATNQNLEKLVEEGAFREDLYFRVNVIAVFLPPLRERREDIPLLLQHFLEQYSLRMNRPFKEFDPAALDLLVRYSWPGNVRELANAVERALVVGTPPTVRVSDLPLRLSETPGASGGDSLAEMEKVHVANVLERCGWNITHAAETLKIDRVTLYHKIEKYGLRK
ncbi:MAG: sigma-54-dependent Fis family transcriptional regulator [Deltaproteobacteria bacterium]|nr:sigma-54-dependent Fis family transcriptional regulator [Deltaproteobacteria bacterium]